MAEDDVPGPPLVGVCCLIENSFVPLKFSAAILSIRQSISKTRLPMSLECPTLPVVPKLQTNAEESQPVRNHSDSAWSKIGSRRRDP